MIFIEVDLIGSIQKDIPTFLLLFQGCHNWWRFARCIFNHRIVRSCRLYGLNLRGCHLYRLNPGGFHLYGLNLEGCHLHLEHFWVMFYRFYL